MFYFKFFDCDASCSAHLSTLPQPRQPSLPAQCPPPPSAVLTLRAHRELICPSSRLSAGWTAQTSTTTTQHSAALSQLYPPTATSIGGSDNPHNLAWPPPNDWVTQPGPGAKPGLAPDCLQSSWLGGDWRLLTTLRRGSQNLVRWVVLATGIDTQPPTTPRPTPPAR